jgi:3-hydroxyacyl-CoA dehydrogenase
VIEFVPEDARRDGHEVESAYPGSNSPLIASGTSGLDLVELSRGMKRPERFLGVHYFMPADTAPVVEVMAGLATARDDVDRVADALRRTGKEPVVLYKPIVGFLVNRLQHAILHEAYYLIEAGVASVEDIDHAARRMLAPRMCLNGLIQQKDISGLKITPTPKLHRPQALPQRDAQSHAPEHIRRGETSSRWGKVSTTGAAAMSRPCASRPRASSRGSSNSSERGSAPRRRGRSRRRLRSRLCTTLVPRLVFPHRPHSKAAAATLAATHQTTARSADTRHATSSTKPTSATATSTGPHRTRPDRIV